MSATADPADQLRHESATVGLTLPADPSFVRVARLVVAGLLADDTGVDVIDDLRVAVDELVALALGEDGEDEVHLTFTLASDELVVTVARSGVAASPEVHPVSQSLLAATTDTVSLDHDGQTFTVQARRRTADPR